MTWCLRGGVERPGDCVWRRCGRRKRRDAVSWEAPGCADRVLRGRGECGALVRLWWAFVWGRPSCRGKSGTMKPAVMQETSAGRECKAGGGRWEGGVLCGL